MPEKENKIQLTYGNCIIIPIKTNDGPQTFTRSLQQFQDNVLFSLHEVLAFVHKHIAQILSAWVAKLVMPTAVFLFTHARAMAKLEI